VPKNDIAIIGYAEAKNTIASGRSVYDIAGELLAAALESAQLDIASIDGLATCLSSSEATNPFWSPFMGDYLGLELNWCQGMDLGGASFLGGVARACEAIRGGACETVLVLAADAVTTVDLSRVAAYRPEWQFPVGLMGPPGTFGLLASRYRSTYDLDDRALAKLAIVQREHALMNDNACEKLRRPLTEEAFLSSRAISDPIRLLDCVMSCDGGSAVIVTSTENAKRTGAKRMAHPIGYGERTNFGVRDPLVDVLEGGHAVAGPRALAQAGLTPADIRMFHPYDDFLIAVFLQLEHIGFCDRGKSSEFVLGTDISHRGTLPINTGGGQISAGQAGLAGGGLNVVEAIRQLFNEAGTRQVAGAGNAMVTGIGCIPYARNWSTSNVMILTT
jgi:acetyl-CoA acetyltransferase